jgi:hypothetical protein
MKTQNFISLAVLASAGLIFAGCAVPPGAGPVPNTGVPPGGSSTVWFQVVSPKPQQVGLAEGYTRTADDHISIVVTFNRPVDTRTVIVGKTLILYFAKNHNAPAQQPLQWSLDHRQLTITTANTLGELATFQPDIHFLLTLKGSPGIHGEQGIRSADGIILDGDYNFQPGGNYVASFVIPG